MVMPVVMVWLVIGLLVLLMGNRGSVDQGAPIGDGVAGRSVAGHGDGESWCCWSWRRGVLEQLVIQF
jgi:hypothetical protein